MFQTQTIWSLVRVETQRPSAGEEPEVVVEVVAPTVTEHMVEPLRKKTRQGQLITIESEVMTRRWYEEAPLFPESRNAMSYYPSINRAGGTLEPDF